MTDFKYRLEPYKGQNTRFTCPRCGVKKNLARYIDSDGNYVGTNVGRCNSEVSCGYHLPPKGNEVVFNNDVTYVPKVTTYLNQEELSTRRYEDNLYKYLITIAHKEYVDKLYNMYDVRTDRSKWEGSTVFYQIDSEMRYRTGKIILYDRYGKRVKDPYSHIFWSHNQFKVYDYVLEQCLFGEHLLGQFDQTKGNIYLVESEKTCLIASLFYQEDLFIATGGLSNLSRKKLAVLDNYQVEAIPDKGGYKLWKEKLEPLGITVNTCMEESDMPVGDDLADLLINDL